ncbi:hypothetical protein Tco_1340473, partial [Tanacetum coccineum]
IDGPFLEGGQYRAVAPGFYQRNNVNPLYQERRQSMEESLRKFMIESAKRHEENCNTIKEIRASTDAAIKNQGASIKTLEIQIGQMSKVLQERGSGSLPSLTETNLIDHFNSISTTVETDTTPIRRIGSTRYAVSTQQNNRTVKHPKGIVENVLVGIELRRNQVGDLEPTIKEDEVVDKPMFDGVKTRNDGNMFYNSIMKDKVEYNGRNVLGTFVNSPIFVGNFFVATNFTVVKNMDAYRDEGMGEVIVGEPFCKASYVVARRLDGMITIFNGSDSVTYQMVRSHLRFKHLTHKQFNKIPPLPKVSEQDRINRISYSYQKLKGFYKEILDLGPEFIRDEKIVERLTCGHISVHEME